MSFGVCLFVISLYHMLSCGSWGCTLTNCLWWAVLERSVSVLMAEVRTWMGEGQGHIVWLKTQVCSMSLWREVILILGTGHWPVVILPYLQWCSFCTCKLCTTLQKCVLCMAPQCKDISVWSYYTDMLLNSKRSCIEYFYLLLIPHIAVMVKKQNKTTFQKACWASCGTQNSKSSICCHPVAKIKSVLPLFLHKRDPQPIKLMSERHMW